MMISCKSKHPLVISSIMSFIENTRCFLFFPYPCSGEHHRRCCCTGTLIQRAECQTGGWADGQGWQRSTLPFSLLWWRAAGSQLLSKPQTHCCPNLQQEQRPVMNRVGCIWENDADWLWQKNGANVDTKTVPTFDFFKVDLLI